MAEQAFYQALQYIKNNNFDLFSQAITQQIINFKDKEQRTLLFYAIINNNIKIFDFLLANKSFLNIVDRHGYSPLHYAVNEHHIEMVKKLIDLGANIEMIDSYGNNVIARAVLTSKGKGEIIKYLLEKGANPNIPNYKGYSAIDVAQIMDQYDLVKYFNQ